MKKDELNISKPKYMILRLDSVGLSEEGSSVVKFVFSDWQNKQYLHFQILPDAAKPQQQSAARKWLAKVARTKGWRYCTPDWTNGGEIHCEDVIGTFYTCSVITRDMHIVYKSNLKESKVQYDNVDDIIQMCSKEYAELMWGRMRAKAADLGKSFN